MSEHIGADEAQALLDAATPLLHRNLRITTTQDCLFGEPDVEDDTYCVYDADEDDPPIVDRIVLPEMAELFAAAPRLAAEVVRLRRELHQWEMSAATLARVVRLLDNNPNAATFDRDDVAGAVGDQLAAARLLGGGE